MPKQTKAPSGWNKGRRRSLALIGALPFASLIPNLSANNQTSSENLLNDRKLAYNLSDPRDQLLIFEKLKGDLSGKQTYGYSEGRVFGIRPDQPEDLDLFGKEVFRFAGCGMHIKRINEDKDIETKSRSWLLYQDPKSGEFIDKMKNPYTGEEVVVPPFRGGIRGSVMTPTGPKVSANFSMESTAIGRPIHLVFTEMGDRVHVTRHAFTRWFEKKSQTHRTEMTLDTYDFDKEALYDKSLTHIPADSHWTSQTSWLSLLNMSEVPGHMIWATNGICFFEQSQLPEKFVRATKEKQPDIFEKPLSWDE
ncbi:MAG: DUF1838 family protein [Bacteroidota bacterium]